MNKNLKIMLGFFLIALTLSSCRLRECSSLQWNSLEIIDQENYQEISETESALYETNSAPGNVFNETTIEASNYYEKNAEIIACEKFEDSSDVLNVNQVFELLESRGFTQYPVIANYDNVGNYVHLEITEETTGYYPMYSTYHTSTIGEIWTIFVINGSVMANPASYNLSSKNGVQVIFSESESVVSYDSNTNTYYETLPHDNVLIIRTVPEINSVLLDTLTIDEIDKL